MADVSGFSLKGGNFERAFTPEEQAYRTAHEAEWPERRKAAELRVLEVRADEALRVRNREAAKADPDAPQEVKDYWTARDTATAQPRTR